MELAEREIELDGFKIREVRRKNEQHQTSILSTNKKLSITLIALYMFARWCQENFFKYMRQEYDIDRMLYYAVQEIDSEVMVVNQRYTKLDMEGKLFQNIIKMICYRAETVVAQLIGSDIYAKQDEIRLLIKSFIKTKGDLIPDYQNKTLTVNLYSQSTPRDNHALNKLCELLTDSETIYPSTELRLIYKLATN